jgi:hypothetical protein
MKNDAFSMRVPTPKVGSEFIKLKNGDVGKWQSYDDKTQMFEFELPNGKRSKVHQRDIEIC